MNIIKTKIWTGKLKAGFQSHPDKTGFKAHLSRVKNLWRSGGAGNFIKLCIIIFSLICIPFLAKSEQSILNKTTVSSGREYASNLKIKLIHSGSSKMTEEVVRTRINSNDLLRDYLIEHSEKEQMFSFTLRIHWRTTKDGLTWRTWRAGSNATSKNNRYSPGKVFVSVVVRDLLSDKDLVTIKREEKLSFPGAVVKKTDNIQSAVFQQTENRLLGTIINEIGTQLNPNKENEDSDVAENIGNVQLKYLVRGTVTYVSNPDKFTIYSTSGSMETKALMQRKKHLGLKRRKGSHSIILAEVVAPKHLQKYYREAKNETKDILLNKKVIVYFNERDKNGCILGRVMINIDDTYVWLNKLFVEKGMVWHDHRISKDKQLADAQIEAKRNKVGLWAYDDPTPPWDYTSNQKLRR